MAKKRNRKPKAVSPPPTVVAPVTVVAPKSSETWQPPLILDGADWINSRWRPWMAIQYLSVCLCDFMFFPVLVAGWQAWAKTTYTPYHPITLEGGGLYHIAMGAIITATAYGRSQEKIAAIKSDMPGSSAAGGSTAVGG